MNEVKTNKLPDFYMKSRFQGKIGKDIAHKKNDPERKQFLNEVSKNDANVQINDSVKDFSKIKKLVEQASDINNSDKIARLKEQIQNGQYRVDYDALADRMLHSEF